MQRTSATPPPGTMPSSTAARVAYMMDADAICDAIDERTLFVPLQHVVFATAQIQDVKKIVAKAKSVGAHVILDCYQSIGAVPFDVTELGVSFACGGSVKYLCGGPGAGYLYVRPDLLAEVKPRLTGWIAHPEPFGFDPGTMTCPSTRRRSARDCSRRGRAT